MDTATRLQDNMTPEIVVKKQMEASIASRTSQARVNLTMNDHLQRVEAYHSGHKKQHAALQLEFHQLAEVLRKVDDAVQQLRDQQVAAKRHSDALPPYDERSHTAMRAELLELEAGIATLTSDRISLQDGMKEAKQTLVLISEEMSFLQTVSARDKYISVNEVAIKRDDHHLLQQMAASVSGKVQETLPSLFDRGSSISGHSPRQPAAVATTVTSSPNGKTNSPRRNVVTPGAVIAAVSSGRINGTNWPSIVTHTYTYAAELMKILAQVKGTCDVHVTQIVQRCASLRTQVVKDQSHAIDIKILQRQRLLVELETLDGKIFDTKKIWRNTSETVKRMKEPLQTNDARHLVRDTVEDNVGAALIDEKAALAKTRHELKKVCRSLALQVDELEAQRKQKFSELEAVDKQLKSDRDHCNVENPANIYGRSHPIRVAAIRTFPHLLMTREIFGTSSTPSSSRFERSMTPVRNNNFASRDNSPRQAQPPSPHRAAPGTPTRNPAQQQPLELVGMPTPRIAPSIPHAPQR